jgi:endonuclease/exonuclease/phosphatase family metal-dependent hydrolase
MSIALVAALATAAPRLPIAGGHPVRPVAIAFANIFKGNEDWAGAREALLNRDVDVLGVIEVPDQRFSNRLNGFADDLPYHTEHGWGGIWSRWPLEEPYELEWNYANLARVVVRRPGDPFVLYLVHGENPLGPASFGDHRAMIERLLDSVEDEHLPVVLIGDLNASDRTSAYRDLEQRLRDAMRVDGAAHATYVGGWWRVLQLRIDHAFVTRDWCAAAPTIFPVPGSDHLGLQVSIGRCRS